MFHDAHSVSANHFFKLSVITTIQHFGNVAWLVPGVANLCSKPAVKHDPHTIVPQS